MKSLALLTLILFFLASCGNNTATTTTTQDSAATPNPTNVQNVNGNMPDTSGSMTLNNDLPKDSSHVKDSLRH
jgi:PBP1b-binding outer membrane lipoprotein LpoB